MSDANDYDEHGDQIDGLRHLGLTPASTIKIKPVHWAWSGRIPLGSLALIAGREGIGKSTLAYTLAAELTKGILPGVHHGQPKSVIVAATEDSWEHTIVPRLLAAGADLDRIFRVDVTTALGHETDLSLPRDLTALEHAVERVDAGMILLDPLMSRLASSLDSHKDADVRRALEPITALGHRTGAAVVGLIHLSKAAGTDPLSLVMGSRAFAAVARAVIFVMKDPDDEELRLVGQPKNNLGRTDLPTLSFRIEGKHVADTDDGPVWTGALKWDAESARSINDALADTATDPDDRTAAEDAAEWLSDYLEGNGGTAPSIDCKRLGKIAGHSESAVKRARQRLRIASTSQGFPRTTYWTLPGTQSAHPSRLTPGESELTELTEPTGPTGGPVGSVGPVSPVGPVPPDSDPTRAQCPRHGVFLVPDRCATCEDLTGRKTA